eukprot:6929781-Prorocentrum_lima.AAC.1
MYSVVPQMVRVRLSSSSSDVKVGNSLARPKSVRQTWPSRAKSRFSGLRSRWMMSTLWRNSRARAISPT